MSSAKFSVAIVQVFCHDHPSLFLTRLFSGGGIGGLALAIALSKYPDIHVAVYEYATEITTAGAGIGQGMRRYLPAS